MSTLKVNQVQIGQSATATQNFTITTNQDGTVKLARGNVGATTQDILSISSGGVVTANQGLAGNGSAITGLPTPAALSTASGSAPSYSARAWVNFNGIGTVAIRASGNVSSITDNGTGDYTVNFTTAMPDANYCPALECTGVGNDIRYNVLSATNNGPATLMTSTQLRIRGWTGADTDGVYVAVFR